MVVIKLHLYTLFSINIDLKLLLCIYFWNHIGRSKAHIKFLVPFSSIFPWSLGKWYKRKKFQTKNTLKIASYVFLGGYLITPACSLFFIGVWVVLWWCFFWSLQPFRRGWPASDSLSWCLFRDVLVSLFFKDGFPDIKLLADFFFFPFTMFKMSSRCLLALHVHDNK